MLLMSGTKNSELGVTITAGNCFWSPVHNLGLLAVEVTQTALYVCALPDQPAEAEHEKPRMSPGDPRPRAVSKFLSGEAWRPEELTEANRAFASGHASIKGRVRPSGQLQGLPGQPAPTGAQETDMAKKTTTTKTKSKARGGRPPADAMLQATEVAPADGALKGHIARVYKHLKACTKHRGSCQTVADRLAKDPEHKSKTDALTLVRYFAPQLRDAGLLTIEWEQGQ